MNVSIRYAIEKAILSTYLHNDIYQYSYIYETELDYNLFQTNITIKSVAKAINIFLKDKLPIDENLILNFISKKMQVDYNEYIKILTANVLSEDMFKQYLNELKNDFKKQKIGELYARI